MNRIITFLLLIEIFTSSVTLWAGDMYITASGENLATYSLEDLNIMFST